MAIINEECQEVTCAEAVAAIQAALNDGEGELTALVGADERPLGREFAVYYVIACKNADRFIHIRVDIPAAEASFPSLTPYIPAANWGEREVRDIYGLRPLGHIDPRPLVYHEGWQAQVVAGEGMVQVPVGPIHAGIIEPGHFRFSTTGENINHLDARLFYTHRGVQKLVEKMPVSKAISTVEATCGVCSVSHAVAFSRACERLAGAKVPERAERWRAILLELERLYNHIGDVSNICAGVGLAYGTQRGAALKERLMRVNEELTGHRYLRHVVVPGGLRRDLPVGELRKNITHVSNDFAKLVAELWEEASLLDRLQTTGVLSFEQAQQMGVVGPAARASGLSCDWRIYHPQPGYEDLELTECLRKTGDVEARALVRIDEVVTSTRLIQQLVAVLQPGDVYQELGPMPTGQPALGYCESPRGSMVHWLMAGEGNTIQRLHIRSAAFANWPAVPLAVRGNIVPDFPLINKSFELCYACCDR